MYSEQIQDKRQYYPVIMVRVLKTRQDKDMRKDVCNCINLTAAARVLLKVISPQDTKYTALGRKM